MNTTAATIENISTADNDLYAVANVETLRELTFNFGVWGSAHIAGDTSTEYVATLYSFLPKQQFASSANSFVERDTYFEEIAAEARARCYALADPDEGIAFLAGMDGVPQCDQQIFAAAQQDLNINWEKVDSVAVLAGAYEQVHYAGLAFGIAALDELVNDISRHAQGTTVLYAASSGTSQDVLHGAGFVSISSDVMVLVIPPAVS